MSTVNKQAKLDRKFLREDNVRSDTLEFIMFYSWGTKCMVPKNRATVNNEAG